MRLEHFERSRRELFAVLEALVLFMAVSQDGAKFSTDAEILFA